MVGKKLYLTTNTFTKNHFNSYSVHKFYSILFLILCCQLASSQSILIKGQIKADSLAIAGVEIINLSTEKSTTSDSQGFFSIMAAEDHLLVFYDSRMDYMRHSVSESDLSNLFVIEMTFKIEELEEVIVSNYSHINAVSLGIVKAGFVMPSKEERLMRSSGGGILTVVNAISGKSKDLKTAYEYSRKNANLEKLQRLNLRSNYTKSFAIAADYHEDFERFVVEDATFLAALQSKHKHRILFQMARLAVDYNEIMKNEIK